MNISEIIRTALEKALQNLDIVKVSFSIEHPTDLSHGDYATNVAMACAKAVNRNPAELAGAIVTEIKSMNIAEIADVSVAGPGFINFKLAPEFFTDSVQEILIAENSFGNIEVNSGKNMLIEHSSPNLFKPFHIGHMMNNTIGESLVRIMRASGAQVTTMSFPSDISIGIAKAIFVLLEEHQDGSVPNDISELGNAYVKGVQRFEEDESIHKRVKEIADNLYAKKDSLEYGMFEITKAFNISYFEEITKKLGSHFDSYIYESQAGEVGKEIVLKNTPAVFTESEGAIVYVPDESKKYLNTSVFINSQGNPTYDAKDLGLLDLKFQKESWDSSLFVTDNEQIPHFNVVLDAAEQINPIWSERSIHIAHGRMRFQGEKMSSRLGNVPLVADMLDTVSDEVRPRMRDASDDGLVDVISIGALKYAILRTKPGQNINFDPETSLSFEGDSGPYLQYTHARITSMVEKASEMGITTSVANDQSTTDLEKYLYRFPEIVQQSASNYAPNYIATYLIELGHLFNSFYGEHKIIDIDNKTVSAHRLALARATQIVIRNGLYLLGIVAPEKM